MSYIDVIKNIEDDTFYSDGNVSGGIINECEKILGLKLPKEYKKYISECGYIGFGDSILLGLDSDGENEERGTVLGDTLFARDEFSLGGEFVVIEYQDYENLYALKCSLDEELEDSPIFSFDIKYDNKLAEPVKVSDSFKEHFKTFVDNLSD
ncbi:MULTISPECIES: SMI1/KNR4 family protein [Tenacibaculum]|uniref:Knr4/Smi1-like domain-containing protein n=1 Tax=Tenacibaculum sp. Pbs-1 TaxID=3238748 RepID=A0AB33KXY0_9FLAO|nr:SMI1/KNR4 family protein [Tenacibaculum mesophilum]